MATQTQIDAVGSQINSLITDQHNEEVTGTILNTVMHAIKDLTPEALTGSFDNDDLAVDFTIDVEHSLGTTLPDVKVFDNTGRQLGPANIDIVVVDQDTVRLGIGAAITGTYTYIVVKHD